MILVFLVIIFHPVFSLNACIEFIELCLLLIIKSAFIRFAIAMPYL